jgi:hypothetical protein
MGEINDEIRLQDLSSVWTEKEMNNRPTPETDAFSISRKEFLKLPKAQRNSILQEQAQALEGHYAAPSDWDGVGTEEDVIKILKERDEAREALQKTRKFLRDANLGAEINARINNSLAGELIELRRERDEAREAAEKWRKLHDAKDELFKKGIAEVERERDEAWEALREWQTLRLWGAEPQHIHDFIKGQQTRIHECQDIEKTCEQLERERDEALTELEMWRDGNIMHEMHKEEIEKAERERDEARADLEFRRGLYKVLEEANNKVHNRLADALHEVDLRTLDYERMKKERDEAREALEEEKKFHHRTHAELIQTQCSLMDVTQAIISTLEENRHLADGDDCTLAKLKSVVQEWK